MSAPEVIHAHGLKILAMPAAGLGVVVPPHPVTAEQVFATNPEVVAAIDGPMFSVCPGETDDYALYQCATVNYTLMDPRHGVSNASQRANAGRGITFSLVGGGITAASGASPAPGASVAVQTYPGLVEAGRVAIGQAARGGDAEANGRIAMGILRDGRLFFAHGRMSMYEFATALRDAGAVWAGYTDGGGSASLVQRLPDGQLEGSDADDPRGRRVPSWIVWAPVESRSFAKSYAVPVLLVAAAAAAAVVIGVRRRG